MGSSFQVYILLGANALKILSRKLQDRESNTVLVVYQ
jgi:hypothetical protein